MDCRGRAVGYCLGSAGEHVVSYPSARPSVCVSAHHTNYHLKLLLAAKVEAEHQTATAAAAPSAADKLEGRTWLPVTLT